MLSEVFKYIFLSLELSIIYDTQGPRKRGLIFTILVDLNKIKKKHKYFCVEDAMVVVVINQVM